MNRVVNRKSDLAPFSYHLDLQRPWHPCSDSTKPPRSQAVVFFKIKRILNQRNESITIEKIQLVKDTTTLLSDLSHAEKLVFNA